MSNQKRYNVKLIPFSPVRGQVKRCRFTLIELRVVIAIIAILAAILLPALQSARERGKTADCLSRKRQVGQFIGFYTNDFGSYFVNHNTTSVNQSSLSSMHSKGWAWGTLIRLLYAKSHKVTFYSFVCTAPGTEKFQSTDDAKWWYTFGATSLKLSEGIFAFNLNHSAVQKTGYGKVMIIADSGKAESGGTPCFKMTTASYSSDYGQISTMHNNKANLLFIDGHSASMSPYDIVTGVKSLSGKDGIGRIERFCMGKWGATYNKMIRI